MDKSGVPEKMSEQEQEVGGIIEEVQKEVLGGMSYQHAMVGEWCDSINAKVIKEMKNLKKDFKFVCNTLIVQKGITGMHSSSNCLWDEETDGVVTRNYDINNISAVTSVYGFSY